MKSHGNCRNEVNKRTPEYIAWQGMKARCNNASAPGFEHYGGKGISVYKGWEKSFQLFLDNMGKKPSVLHSLDRYPNKNGNYEPGNLRWALPTEQSRNKNNNTLLDFNGEKKTLAEWSSITGLSRQVIQFRIKHMKMTIEQALTTPLLRERI